MLPWVVAQWLMRRCVNEATVGSNPDGFIFYFFILTDISFYSCFICIIESDYDLFSLLKMLFITLHYSTGKLCVLIKRTPVINTRIRTRPVYSFAQFMLLNSLP